MAVPGSGFQVPGSRFVFAVRFDVRRFDVRRFDVRFQVQRSAFGVGGSRVRWFAAAAADREPEP